MKKYILTLLFFFNMFLILMPLKTMAAETGSYTTITVDASDDTTESGSLMYSIDSDEPSAFTTDNEFVVEAGTSHVVYVKDAAGNISSQMITAPIEKVGIEVTIGQDGTDSAVTATPVVKEAVESGGGTAYEKTVTDGSSNSEKIFYTITTKDENVFYMVVDNSRSADNVYLLNQVTEEDLLSLTDGANAEKKSSSIFSQETPADNGLEEKEEIAEETTTSGSKSTIPFVAIIVLAMGGGYYYMKVYKPKKDAEMDLEDAMDIDEFEAEEEGEEEEELEERQEKTEIPLEEMENNLPWADEWNADDEKK